MAFLNEGFKVRGTVRDPDNEAKIAPLRVAFGEKFDQIELVRADLLDEESMLTALEGTQYVAHVASPFVLEEPSDENVLIKPAVDGTLGVLKACAKHGVKRVVLTSSVVAVMHTSQETKP